MQDYDAISEIEKRLCDAITYGNIDMKRHLLEDVSKLVKRINKLERELAEKE